MTESNLIFKAPLGAYVGDGWAPIVNKLYEDLRAIDPEFVCQQVKEKFGGLRFYFDVSEGASDEAAKEMDRLVDKAKYQCAVTCEFCGDPGKLREQGWLKTLCDPCAVKYYDEGKRPWADDWDISV